MTLPPLILTRPAAQAQAWADQLAGLGVPTHCLPLIETQALADVRALARQRVAASDWVFFTSPAAVAALFDGGWDWPTDRRATCVGPGTAAALLGAGVPVAALLSPPLQAEQFDSEHLWPLLREASDWPGRRMLWLCGQGGRDWLIQRLQGVGCEVELLPIYRRIAATLDPVPVRERLAAPGLWLFSSSEAIGYLQQLVPGTTWASVQALATHPRIAERAVGLGMPCQVVRPQPDAVAAAWRRWVRGAAS